MVNCNPETVSTDYDISDRLYFEPLTAEDVANVLDAEAAAGGRAWSGSSCRSGARPRSSWPTRSPRAWSSGPPRRRSTWPRTASGGTSCASRSASPSRRGAPPSAPPTRSATAHRVGYPVLVRPSYVLGGRAMEIVYDDDGVRRVMAALSGAAGLAREGGDARRAAGARRPFLRGRHRGRRRRRARRHRRGPRLRGDGARRRGRRALG